MDDADGYCLIEEQLFDERGDKTGSILVLGTHGRRGFLSKMRATKRQSHDALLISIASTKLLGTSVKIANEVKLIRPLSDTSGIYAFELRPNPRQSVIRVMVYLPGLETKNAILLYAFKGHRGDKGSIPKEELDRAKQMATIAKWLFEKRQAQIISIN